MCRKESKLGQLVLLLVLTAVLFPGVYPAAVSAEEEMTLAEAFNQGREGNAEILDQREELQGIETSLREVAAGLNWQLDLTGSAAYGNTAAGLMKSYYFAENSDEEAGGMGTAALNLSRSYFSGLQLSSSLSLTETQPFKLENLEDKYTLDLNLSQRLYPRIPTQPEKQYYQLENQWEVSQIRYQALLNSRETDWLELYLNWRSLEKALPLAEEGYQLALKNLEQVRGEAEIGEAGRPRLLAAEIELKGAELSLKKARTGAARAADGFYQALGLAEERPRITGVEEYLQGVKTRIDSAGIDYFNLKELKALLKEENHQLLALEAGILQKEEELKWQQAEGEPRLTASGNYNYNKRVPGSDEWQVGLSLSYNLFDSGQQQASLERLQGELAALNRRYQMLLQELESGLKSLISQLELDVLDRDSKALASEKAGLEIELAEGQLAEGLITSRQYRQKVIQGQEALNKLEASGDRILIDQLRILNYLGRK